LLAKDLQAATLEETKEAAAREELYVAALLIVCRRDDLRVISHERVHRSLQPERTKHL
jgi:hypothetical protein